MGIRVENTTNFREEKEIFQKEIAEHFEIKIRNL